MKHIGIVACSAEGAALCYRTICVEGEQFLGEHRHPEISMHTFSLGEYMDFIYQDDWKGVADLMLSSAAKLKSVGAEFAICPDNTLHQAFAHFNDRSPLPWLHIAEPVYPSRLNPMGIETTTPSEEQREKINAVIFEELVKSKFLDESRDYFSNVIVDLQNAGCDGVVLGCTEIPLLMEQQHSALPVFDSTRLLARAALRHAIEVQD
jgi:aspartate racemase